MGLTVTKLFQTVVGDRRMHVYTALGDNSYAANGESLTKADLGFAATADPEFHVMVDGSGGYVAEYDYANSKLLVYQQTDSDNGVPLGDASTADLSAVTFRVTAFGRWAL